MYCACPSEEILNDRSQFLPKYVEQWGLEMGKVGGALFRSVHIFVYCACPSEEISLMKVS